MPYNVDMGQDGILRIELSGDLSNGIVKTFRRELAPYVEAATPSQPLKNILYFKQVSQISPAIRHFLIDLSKDQRLGKTAFVRPSRKARVLGEFMRKASDQEKFDFFEREQDAVLWLRNSQG